MSICKWCGIEVPVNMASYHSRVCEKNPNHDHNIKVLSDNAIKTTAKVLSSGGYPQHTKPEFINKERFLVCPGCGSEFTVICSDYKFEKGDYKHFCSRSCANKRVHSDETKRKITESLVKFYNEQPIVAIEKTHSDKNKTPRFVKILRTCGVCGKQYIYAHGESTKKFCSKECSEYYRSHRKEFLSEDVLNKLSVAGKKSAYVQRKERRSKNEILFCELCEKEYQNVLHNVPMFNGWDADVILTEQKVAVLWNGKWHYEEIMPGTSLLQIQNRDDIKIKEIKKCGYVPYIIKDTGKYKESFVKEQFDLFKTFINNLDK